MLFCSHFSAPAFCLCFNCLSSPWNVSTASCLRHLLLLSRTGFTGTHPVKYCTSYMQRKDLCFWQVSWKRRPEKINEKKRRYKVLRRDVPAVKASSSIFYFFNEWKNFLIWIWSHMCGNSFLFIENAHRTCLSISMRMFKTKEVKNSWIYIYIEIRSTSGERKSVMLGRDGKSVFQLIYSLKTTPAQQLQLCNQKIWLNSWRQQQQRLWLRTEVK